MRGRENLLDFRDRDRVDRSASTPADSSQEMNGRHSGGLNVLWANLSGAHIYREANQESVHAAAMGLARSQIEQALGSVSGADCNSAIDWTTLTWLFAQLSDEQIFSVLVALTPTP